MLMQLQNIMIIESDLHFLSHRVTAFFHIFLFFIFFSIVNRLHFQALPIFNFSPELTSERLNEDRRLISSKIYTLLEST